MLGSFLKVDPAIPLMNAQENMLLPQVIIFAPTQELINQIVQIGRRIFQNTGVTIASAAQKVRCHIIVGTVQAVVNLYAPTHRKLKKLIEFEHLRCVAIDEADFIFHNEQDYQNINKMLGVFHTQKPKFYD